MNSKVLKIIAVIGIVFVIGLIFVGKLFGTLNREADLRTRIEATQKRAEVTFDKTWRTTKQVAGVADKYTETLKEVVQGTFTGRYGDGGSKAMFQFLKEANPQIDSSIFKQVMATVEVYNAEFAAAQKDLIADSQEHNQIMNRPISGTVLSMLGKRKIEIKLVTSTATENAYKTGKNDDVDLFKK